ncbi:MAG: right-handed parallel beta-helix repeat-containing protein [Bacteroidales bacterium]|nr:right-handed parallel beta-helix repeat-containing protein [Bacteroidales bacterium]
MKKVYFIFVLIALIGQSALRAQTYMNMGDNIDIPGYSWIIFNPGTYTIPDPGNDGLIRINNQQNIILDGANVAVDGMNYSGYMIKINNSKNITIRNFESASRFKYAVYITNSDSIQIYNCDFSFNKVDSAGWIDVWSDYQSALGGGVMMYLTDYVDIHNNTMKMQNDGVALYHCNHISIWENDFDWNTSYGVRMYFTNSCHIHHNLASHVNRPFTNPSDCAAILMIVSNENLVEHNDFSYSGDGIFLGQYEYSSTPNNNVFLYNECSYSPHNAIEATFADGNIYRCNACNYSHYGLWLGYSFNSLVDSNEIIGNQSSGIAIDRGFSNIISQNMISDNPIGIELWEGSAIPPYQNQFSHDYLVKGNLLEGNRLAIKSNNTEHLVFDSNAVIYNNDGIQLNGSSPQDTFYFNYFKNNALYHIENLSPDDIYAPYNSFFSPDEDFIACNIYDFADNPAKGEVIWHPFFYGEPPVVTNEQLEDMTEPTAEWYAYPEVCGGYGGSMATTVSWDSTDMKEGVASVHCVTGNGWDIGLQYWPGSDTIVHWQLSGQDTLIFWLKTVNTTGYGFQFHQIRVGNLCGGYYKYSGSPNVLNAANGTWKKIKVPLAGGGSPYNYVRTEIGEVSFDDISYVSIHADTWDFGFEIWLDGMHFSSFSTGLDELNGQNLSFNCLPNPMGESAIITWRTDQQGPLNFELFDLTGKQLYWKELNSISETTNQFVFCNPGISPGLYLASMKSAHRVQIRKLIIR